MSNVINLKQDLSSTLKSEGNQYAELAISILTTSGSGSFVSISSGTTYNYTSGTQDLFNQLAVVLADYSITALDYDLLRSFIYGQGTPLLDGMQTKLVKVNGVLTEVQLYKADLTTLIAKTVLNKTNGVLTSVDNYVYNDAGTVVVVQYKETLNKINGVLDNVVRTVQV